MTQLDVFAAVALTAAAAATVATIVAAAPAVAARTRLRAAIWFAAWFAALSGLAGAGALASDAGFGAGVGLAAVVPLIALAWLAHRTAGWRGLAGAWTVLGILDLIDAVALGILSAPGAPLAAAAGGPDTTIVSALPWVLIPGYLVPILFALHMAALARLVAPRGTRSLAAA